MRLDKAVMLLTLGILVVGGCSDKKKEAARQDQIVAEPAIDTTLTMDTLLDTTLADMTDTLEAVESEPGFDMPRAPQGDGYVVQVASCTDEAYASYLVDLWSGRGYEPFVSTITYNDETHYRVRIGLYDSIGAAKQLVSELLDKYSLETWIDHVTY